MAERKGAAKRCVLTNGPAIVVRSRVAFTRSAVTTPTVALGPRPSTARRRGHAHSLTAAAQRGRRRRRRFFARVTLRRRLGSGREAPHTTHPTHNTGQGRLVPRRGRAPAARDRGPRHAQVVRPRGAPAGPHGQAVPGAVAQPAEPRHQQAALDGRRGQGHPAELRAVRRALGRHRPGPAGAHGQRRQEPLELFDETEDRAVLV